MTRLSVNINKIATLRNARGGNNPDVVKAAIDCERFGAQGITVHPRPDERHIRYSDVINLKKVVKTEFNIEGYPDERYLKLIQGSKASSGDSGSGCTRCNYFECRMGHVQTRKFSKR